MKKLLISLLAGALAAGSVNAAPDTDCDKSAAKLEAAIKKDPEKVLVLLTDALAKNTECACELVKAAIEASDADVKLVRQIVTAAVLVEDVDAPTVAECAMAAMPEAASEIKAALKEVFAGIEGGSDDDVVVDQGDAGYGPINQVVSGVYLIPPIAGGRRTSAEIIREVIRQRTIREVIVITSPAPMSP